MIRLYFYTYSDESQFHALDAGITSHRPWLGLRGKIRDLITAGNSNNHINIEEGETDGKPEESIVVLFLPAIYLSSKKKFFDAMSQSKNNPLRPTTKPKKRHGAEKPFYYPIITVSMPDIMGLFTGSLEKECQASEKKYLLDLHPDKRFKFLDSSIWHRYVPLCPNEETFEDRFLGVFNEITGYWATGLYYTHAAIATLEFQVRMLRHSFITKTGDRGHDENVTPFKFHSESWMRQKAEEEIRFFTFEGWNGGSLLQQLNWRVLIIDDQAKGRPVSSVNDKCRLEKEELILKPLSDLYTKYNLKLSDKVIAKVPHDGESHDDLVRASLDCMREASYDIIFLDYLLGNHQFSDYPPGNHWLGGRREYGYEFILNLIEENQKSENAGARPVRRDFQGRHWIFQISSFPFAFPDKLNQLGLSHLHEIWHLGHGGDPITTPHLYAYYLYRFMKQKVGRYFLYPELLERIFREVPVDISQHKNRKLWATFLYEALESRRKQDKLLEEHTFDGNTSLFLRSIREFIRQNDTEKILTQFYELLEHLLGHVIYPVSDFEAKCVKMASSGGIYGKALQIAAKIAAELALKEYRDAQRMIEKTSEAATNIDLSGLMITEVPKEISKLTNLETINLSGNRLSEFPYILFELKKLRIIDLERNNLEWLPSVGAMSQLKNLVEINLSNNPDITLNEIKGINPGGFLHKLQQVSGQLKRSDKSVHVFIGYSRNDAKHMDVFVKKLSAFKYTYDFTFFYDKKNNAGLLWDEEVKKQIALADLIVFLCSDEMLASEYIRKTELPLAMSRHEQAQVHIVPVILHPCNWQVATTLGRFQALPFGAFPTIEEYDSDGKLQEGWNHVVHEIVKTHFKPIS